MGHQPWVTQEQGIGPFNITFDLSEKIKLLNVRAIINFKKSRIRK